MTQNKRNQMKWGLVTFYELQPENGTCLF